MSTLNSDILMIGMQTDGPSHSSQASKQYLRRRSPPLRKRRRVPLACISCRQRKSRCDGERPSCSPCLDFEIDCVYEEISQEQCTKRRGKQSEQAQLARRVRELESRLSSVPAEPCKASFMDNMAERLNSASPSVFMNRDPDITSGSTSTIIRPETEPNGTTDEVAVDVLATDMFNDAQNCQERDIGYFGPTSNHALFRSLSDAFAHITRLHYPSRQYPMGDSAHIDHGFTWSRSPVLTSYYGERVAKKESEPVSLYALPSDEHLVLLINHFFDTVGMVMPYVSKSDILSEYHRSRQENPRGVSRPMQALLNIICAFASSTLCSGSPEIYYHRALGLLDEKTLRGSSKELIQVLLLIGSFQQNNQRSVASWTLHATTVKAAFQLGLHSPAFYKDDPLEHREFRKRLWYAVVNQDRSLSISLGRPCLIPAQHNRVEKPQDPSMILSTTPLATPTYNDSLIYFNSIISLNAIKGSILESLYDSNIESLEWIAFEELMIRIFHLSWQLEQWRGSPSTSSFGDILSGNDLSQWSAASYAAKRFQVLVSIQYYSATLLINGPALTRFLSQGVKERQSARDTSLLLETMIPLLKKTLSSARQLSTLIDGANSCGEPFLDCNGAWWMCNYSTFTVNLHLFGIILACKRYDEVFSIGGIQTGEVRSSLEYSLRTLRAIERTSLMSRKAGDCLRRFLKVFDSLASEPIPAIENYGNAQVEGPITIASLGSSGQFPPDHLPENFFSQYVGQSADDFLFQCSDNAFLDADMDFFQSLN